MHHVDGKLFKIIHILYANAKSCLQMGHIMSEPLVSNVGVHQPEGENLSSILFSMFLNDLTKLISHAYNGLNDLSKILLSNTPGKLSQVHPRRYRLMVVTDIGSYLWWSKTRHKKIGVRLFLIKYTITREFTENQTVLFDRYRHKVLSYVISPRTFHIYQRYDLQSGFEVSPKYSKQKKTDRCWF